jgi:hypothetical protein
VAEIRRQPLKTVKVICDVFGLTDREFYIFVGLGMPVRKINGNWYGDEQNIYEFFRKVTHGKPANVDAGEVKRMLGEEMGNGYE